MPTWPAAAPPPPVGAQPATPYAASYPREFWILIHKRTMAISHATRRVRFQLQFHVYFTPDEMVPN